MYHSKFAFDIENMLKTLRNGGLKLVGIDFFFADFDNFCKDVFPDASTLTQEIGEKWIHNTSTNSKAHMWRRVNAMKHLGKYQLSLGKKSYIPTHAIKKNHAEEPRLFSDEQLAEFFEKVDTEIAPTVIFPYKDVILPVIFRVIYCCGLRSSEACNLKVNDVDLARGTLAIYHSKGFKDRLLFMDDNLCDLLKRFHTFYNKKVPRRAYFFQPSHSRECFTSGDLSKFFDAVLLKTSFCNIPGKKFTAHGLRHLFAVQNIRKCAEQGENFANWIQYLYKYMGHKSIQNTMYYLHITSQLFPIYNKKLRLLEEGAGVMYVEE